jgi:hypothetical protein
MSKTPLLARLREQRGTLRSCFPKRGPFAWGIESIVPRGYQPALVDDAGEPVRLGDDTVLADPDLGWRTVRWPCGCTCAVFHSAREIREARAADAAREPQAPCSVNYCRACVEASPFVPVVVLSQSGSVRYDHVAEIPAGARNVHYTVQRALDRTAPWGAVVKRILPDGTLAPLAWNIDSSG